MESNEGVEKSNSSGNTQFPGLIWIHNADLNEKYYKKNSRWIWMKHVLKTIWVSFVGCSENGVANGGQSRTCRFLIFIFFKEINITFNWYKDKLQLELTEEVKTK